MSKINWVPTDLELRDVKVTPAEAITAVDRVRKTLVLFIAFGKGSDEVIKDYELLYTSMATVVDDWSDEEGPGGSDDENEGYGLPADLSQGFSAPRPQHPALPSRPFVPRLQNWRMNLCGLSQVYGLYFAAYGFLGDMELVVTACDNGDVIAYYTSEVARYISAMMVDPQKQATPPLPFFHENVGTSAWGLALHAKTRLLAVSSNRHEVTVFAFALNRLTRSFSSLVRPRMRPAEAAVLSRKRDWRIMLHLGRSGNNIPSIDFVSNDSGHAEKVCAVDISEQFWLLDIWRPCTSPTLLRPRDVHWGHRQSYWGVLALPDSSFLDVGTHSPRQGLDGEVRNWMVALGLNRPVRPGGTKPLYWIDTTSSLGRVLMSLSFNPDQDDSTLEQYSLRSRAQADGPMATGHLEFYNAALSHNQAESIEGDGDESLVDDIDDEDEDDDDDDEEGGDEAPAGETNTGAGGDDDSDSIDMMATQPPPDPHTSFLYHTNANGQLTSPIDTAASALLSSAVSNLATVMDPPDIPPQTTYASHQHLPLLPYPHLPRDVQTPRSSVGAPSRMRMLYKPHLGKTFKEPHTYFEKDFWLRRRREYNEEKKKQNQAGIAAIADNTSFFVTGSYDIRLLSTDADFIDLYCQDPFRGPRLPGTYTHIYRTNMILHVPELNLVVAGNQAGRVALISLIKCAFAQPRVRGDRCFRVDMLLPTRREEAKRKLRPNVPSSGSQSGRRQKSTTMSTCDSEQFGRKGFPTTGSTG
ncbi:unnamed protein product [Parascedosporium putredinis]|uniref:Uncharacterized protein n=1 Tax=Parascedosporium putredinis TaxID=1442378 RepID=A0A9P1MAN2_9PEZI|nr:unnamed protein product [Parascedosporium putredinis]CAI7997965.1 unnamed protein product [Parascedosporium putredinis]